MSFLTSRMYSTLSPPRQSESTTSFLPLARGRWELSIFFCCFWCGKSWFSTIGQHNFVWHFSNFVGRFSNLVGDFPNFVGDFPNFVGDFPNFVGRFSNFVGRFSNFVGVFSVCLVSMCKMCATITTIHGLSVQPDAHARELLSLYALKSRLRSVKFSLRAFRLGRCKRRWLQDSVAMVGDSPKRRLAP